MHVVVYKPLLVKEKGGKVVYKIFIVNVVSMRLSAIWQFWLFKGHWPGSPGGLYGLCYSGGVSPSGGKSPEVRGVQKCEDTMDRTMFVLATQQFEVLVSRFSKWASQLMLIRTKFLKLTFSTWQTHAQSQPYKNSKSVNCVQRQKNVILKSSSFLRSAFACNAIKFIVKIVSGLLSQAKSLRLCFRFLI